GLLFIKGSVPGSKNGWLLVRDAIKLPAPADAPFPGAVKETAKPANDEPQVEAAADTPAEVAEAPASEETKES
ncbi:MAG: 50S ribosomal protein L3, partial [Pseudomonadota bacterium]